MRGDNFLWQEKAMAGNRIGRIKIRFREDSRSSKTGKGREGNGNFIGFQMLANQTTSTKVGETSHRVLWNLSISAYLWRMLHSTENKSGMDPV
jgi:hypothetical protein